MNWIFELIKGGFTNPKTTVTAIVGALIMLANSLGVVHITPEQQSAFVIVVLVIVSWFSADATNVSTEKK